MHRGIRGHVLTEEELSSQDRIRQLRRVKRRIDDCLREHNLEMPPLFALMSHEETSPDDPWFEVVKVIKEKSGLSAEELDDWARCEA